MTTKARRHGFTLIELLIALGIISIIAGMGAFSMSDYRQRLQLDAASQTVATTLREMSERAVANSQGVELKLDAAKTGLSWTYTGQSAVLGKVSLPHGIKAALASGSSVSYSGRGLPVQAYELTLTSAKYSKKIHLQPTGQVFRP